MLNLSITKTKSMYSKAGQKRFKGEKSFLKMENISKHFPGVLALDDVSITLNSGEVLVLLGENGAGKSTLMKILTGVYPKDTGRIFIRDEEIEINNPREALDLGINMVYQESNLALHLNVAENIYLGREFLLHWGLGIIDRKTMYEKTEALLETLNLPVSPKTSAKNLTIAHRQMVEIAKALSAGADIIVLDEPTASLTDQEIKQLFNIIRQLKLQGVAFIYISHRLEEIAEIGDRVNVLRDGQLVGTVPPSTSMDTLIRMMVGRDVEELFPKTIVPKGMELLRVDALCSKGILDTISFSIREGEIVGIAGLVGARRTELARTIFGADSGDSGRIYLRGQEVRIESPADAIKLGIGYLSEDRKLYSLALNMSVKANITLASLQQYCSGPFLNRKKESVLVEKYIEDLTIKAVNQNQNVQYLSGGNQQKVVVARWIATDAQVLIFDEPTTGVDVGAKVEVYQLMNRLVMNGKAIIFISSYFPELLALCDRILVMSSGKITHETPREKATQEEILYYSAVGRR